MDIEFEERTTRIVSVPEIPDVLDAALAFVVPSYKAAEQEDRTAMRARWGFGWAPIDLSDSDMIQLPYRHYAPLWGSNREINPHRVAEYADAMHGGNWWFTPDPIVFSEDGDVLNGQHRIAAVLHLNQLADFGLGSEKDRDIKRANALLECAIEFVLVTGVEQKAALIMDEARRTATDRRDLIMKIAS